MPTSFAYHVLDTCDYATLALTDSEGAPYAVPLSVVRVGDAVYFHCAMQGKKVDALKRDNRVMLVAVKNVVPSTTEFSTEYDSAMVFGRAAEVTNNEEKVLALRLLCERYTSVVMPLFDGEVARSIHRTAVYKITIERASGKQKKYPQ